VLVTHSLTSIAIGAIFGALTGKVRSLKITHFGKGIGEGMIAAIVLFAVLFVPGAGSCCNQH